VRLIIRMLSYVAAVVVVQLHAAEQGIEPFWERFEVAFDRRVQDQFAERLHPFNVMSWSIELGDNNYDDLRERITSAAHRALTKSVMHGLREAAIDLPIMLWLTDRQGFLADFLRNSVGNVAEEAVSSLDVLYDPVERSWWKRRLAEDRHFRYGIRPFRTSPYAFLSLSIKDGDTLFLLGHVRYHYREFSEHRFEIVLALPLPHGLAIDIGTSYQLGQDAAEQRVVFKLAKEFKGGGILHVGLEVREYPAFLAGIAFPW
jgi:hypothetical protein